MSTKGMGLSSILSPSILCPFSFPSPVCVNHDEAGCGSTPGGREEACRTHPRPLCSSWAGCRQASAFGLVGTEQSKSLGRSEQDQQQDSTWWGERASATSFCCILVPKMHDLHPSRGNSQHIQTESIMQMNQLEVFSVSRTDKPVED